MHASVQWLAPSIGLVRIHPVGGYGSPWTWACCIVRHERQAEIYIAEHAPTHKEVGALHKLFASIEVDSVLWERRDEHGNCVMKEFKVRR